MLKDPKVKHVLLSSHPHLLTLTTSPPLRSSVLLSSTQLNYMHAKSIKIFTVD